MQLPILDRAALEAMRTGSLLARLRKLLACEESLAASDRFDDKDEQSQGGIIEFKQSAEWVAAHREFKEILCRSGTSSDVTRETLQAYGPGGVEAERS